MKNIYLSLFLFCLTTSLNAQWTKIHESEQGNLGAIHAISEQEIWVANIWQNNLAKIENSNIQTNNFTPFGFLSDIQFLNQQIGYVSGGCYYVFEDCPATTFYKTTDGGESWENILSNFFTTGVLKNISLPSENDIYLCADYNGLLHSPDGGETWETITLPESYSPNYYIDAQFITPEQGYLAFIDGYEIIPDGYAWKSYVLFTENGGDTWEQVFEVQLPNNQISALTFATPDIGFLVTEQNYIYKTENRGMTWDTLTIVSSQEKIGSFALVNADVAYLSTASGEEFKSRIYKTENGGQTWDLDVSFDSVYVNQLHFIDEENGFAGVGNVLYQRMGTTNTTEPALLDFKIFPNPSSESITIEWENISVLPLSLNIRNQLGQIVTEKQITQPNSSISIHHLPPSIYYLEMSDENGNLLGIKKLIKK